MDSNNVIETNDNGIGDHDIKLGTCRFTRTDMNTTGI